jgi:hypothetical protein
MIAPLRRAHRHTFTFLAMAVPVMFAIGLGARHPRVDSVRPAVSGVETRSAAGHFSLITSADQRVAVRIHTPAPDPLLYWSAAAPSSDALSNSRFIGPADPNRAYELPQDTGYLVLYSGGHQRIVDFVRLESRP